MSAARELLESLQELARSGAPDVRALHVPPVASESGKKKSFCAIELSDGTLGLAYIALGDTRARMVASDIGVCLRGANLDVALAGWGATDGVARAIACAAGNALTRHFFDRAGFVPPRCADSVAGIAPMPGDRIGMIGYFAPLVGQIVRSGAELVVLELRDDLAGEYAGFEVTLEPGVLARCNKILCTSTVMLNDSFESLLRHGRAAESFVIIGPGAGYLPDPLFARGVTRLAGSWIEDAPALLDALMHGEPWGRSVSKFAIDRDVYPGLSALRDRGRTSND